MDDFDVDAILRFRLPRYLCHRCCAILYDVPIDWTTLQGGCPSCGLDYDFRQAVEEDARSFAPDAEWTVHSKFAWYERHITFTDLFGHMKALSEIALDSRSRLTSHAKAFRQGRPPVTTLLQALMQAQAFVHFASGTISPMFLGALKLTAQRVQIRGVLTDADPELADELTMHKAEAPNLDIRIVEQDIASGDESEAQRPALVVIDGLLAFTSFYDFAESAWRMSRRQYVELYGPAAMAEALGYFEAAGFPPSPPRQEPPIDDDTFEVVTDVGDVVDLHNRTFCPLWLPIERRTAEVYPVPMPEHDMKADDIPF